MTRVLGHRGPDGEGTVLFEGNGGMPSGFGHRRLSIIDLSPAAGQPMTVSCQRCRSAGIQDLGLTYNGEIYNYQALRAQLEAKGHRFGTRSDSEVLLHLYGEHGPEMLGLLNGMFAFGIRDGRASGRAAGVERGDLFLARDHLGIKPLYYSALPEGFLFASELKALLCHPGVSREIDPVALHHHVAYLWSPAPRTMLRDVHKLEPAHAMIVGEGRVRRTWSFYDLPYGRAPLTDSMDRLAESLREIVQAAVRRQMVSDVPVGAFLSGGLDSSAVVAMMRGAGPGPSMCYAIGFGPDYRGDENPDDLPYARLAARALDVPLTEIVARPSMIDRLDEMLYHLDEPQADPAPINAMLIAERAKQDGIKVLLSGAGGDDVLAGYRRHWAVEFERYWVWLPRPARRGLAAAASVLGGRAGRFPGQYLRRAAKMFAAADLPDDRRMASYFWWSGEPVRRNLYTRDLAASVGHLDTAAPLLQSLARIPAEREPLNRMLYLEAKHFLADHNLNYTDKMAMASGVEVRVPLIDIEVVDFATRIPVRHKYRGAVGKAVFKRAMEGVLPDKVIYRSKTGFGAPLRRWLREELRPRVDDTLSASVLTKRGWFEPTAVRSLVEADRAGRVDGSYTIFALMCLELWARRFLDGGRW